MIASRTLLAALLAAFLLLLAPAAPADAQQGGGGPPAATPSTAGQPSAAPRAFVPPPQARPAPQAGPPGVFERAYAWIVSVQGDLNQRLARSVRDLRTANPLLAALTLIGMSFAYGVLHAIGPGHGKAIVSSYVLADDRTVRRGIALSFLAAAFQALSALLLVAVLVGIFSATGLGLKATEAWLETVSWGLVVLVGVWLLWRQLAKLRLARIAAPVEATRHTHAHGHAHTHAHAHAHTHDHAHAHAHGHAHRQGREHAHSHAHGHGDHHHGHQHGQHQHGHAHGADCCGHAHMPAPKDLEGAWSWRKAIPLALAIGIRPCTGAIAVLIFALTQGMVWAGVLSTLAMALGTAIAVSALAVLTVGSRDLAIWLGGESRGWGTHIRTAAGIGGALAVIGLGLLLFIGSLKATAII